MRTTICCMRLVLLICGLMLGVALTLPVFAEGGRDHSLAAAGERVGDVYPLAVDPVSGESLVEVDEPVVVIHEGRELHFVSEQTAEQFKSDPATYLEKVDAMIVEQQDAVYPLDTCVVTDEKLGVEGKPVDYVYGNRLVRFCCAGCDEEFNKDPATYLEKLDAAVIERDSAAYPVSTCLVSGEKMGEMGEPVKYVIANRLVEFCCNGCKKDFEKNPAKYLHKLDEADGSGGEDHDAASGEESHTEHNH